MGWMGAVQRCARASRSARSTASGGVAGRETAAEAGPRPARPAVCRGRRLECASSAYPGRAPVWPMLNPALRCFRLPSLCSLPLDLYKLCVAKSPHPTVPGRAGGTDRARRGGATARRPARGGGALSRFIPMPAHRPRRPPCASRRKRVGPPSVRQAGAAADAQIDGRAAAVPERLIRRRRLAVRCGAGRCTSGVGAARRIRSLPGRPGAGHGPVITAAAVT